MKQYGFLAVRHPRDATLLEPRTSQHSRLDIVRSEQTVGLAASTAPFAKLDRGMTFPFSRQKRSNLTATCLTSLISSIHLLRLLSHTIDEEDSWNFFLGLLDDQREKQSLRGEVIRLFPSQATLTDGESCSLLT